MATGFTHAIRPKDGAKRDGDECVNNQRLGKSGCRALEIADCGTSDTHMTGSHTIVANYKLSRHKKTRWLVDAQSADGRDNAALRQEHSGIGFALSGDNRARTDRKPNEIV